jgi:predicted acetyltransferase
MCSATPTHPPFPPRRFCVRFRHFPVAFSVLFRHGETVSIATQPPFTFCSPGRLVDRELELVAPAEAYIDDILQECGDALTQAMDSQLAQTSRGALLDFLHYAPGGRVAGDPQRGQVPAYHFWMRWHDETGRLRMGGGIGVRISSSLDIELYAGHIGYHVYPPARGRHFAERACRLVAPVLRFHGISPVWITCNPDNLASRRTCERLGARYVEMVDLPSNHAFYARGERQKCRYRWGI